MTLPMLIKEAEPTELRWKIRVRDAVNGVIKRLMGVGSVRPDNPTVGTQHYDTTLSKPIWYAADGTWKDAGGSIV